MSRDVSSSSKLRSKMQMEKLEGAHTHEALPEQPARNASHEAKSGKESSSRSAAAVSTVSKVRNSAWNVGSLPPAGCGEGVGKRKRTQDVRRYEVFYTVNLLFILKEAEYLTEDCAGGSCSHGSGSVDPLFIGDGCAAARVREVDVGYHGSAALFFGNLAF